VQAIGDCTSEETLGRTLIEEGLITAEQLQTARQVRHERGGKLGDVLVSQGSVTAEDLASVYSVLLNVPLIDLTRHNVQPDAVRLVPEKIARRHTLIPLDVVGDRLLVAMADPGDVRAIEDIRAHARMGVEVALALPKDIEQAIDLNYRSMGELEERVKEFAPPPAGIDETASELIARTPIARSLDLLVTQAVRDRASDAHIEPQEGRIRVRYRVDGVLRDVLSLPTHAHSALVSRVKILADMDISERRRPQDGQFSVTVRDRDVDIRAATMDTSHGERVTLRILDKGTSLFTLPELGLLPDALRRCQTMLQSPYGMVLVGGPTGSGKTTTLYASVGQLNRDERNVMTIEDPIEYGFDGISQTQVNVKAGITFAGGLRAILRHDPDVVLVGEIRDRDTAETAVQAALTGHLVLSSIHANDAVGALLRLADLGVEKYLVASTLVGVIAQRMVRRVCQHCAVSSPPSVEDAEVYREERGEEPPSLPVGKGCNLCAGTGYRGRIGIFEVLTVSERARDMLAGGASMGEMKAQALNDGMTTMKRDGMLKVRDGITTISEVMRSVFSPG